MKRRGIGEETGVTGGETDEDTHRERDTSPRALSVLIGTAAFVITVAGMRAAAELLVPFLLSVFIAIMAAPSLFWLQRRRVPTALALLIVIGGILIVGMALGVLVGSSIDDFSGQLPRYQAGLQEKTQGLFSWIDARGITIPEGWLRSSFDPGAAMRLASRTLSSLGGVLANGFLILLTVVFILVEASGFPAKVRSAVPNAEESLGRLDSVVENVKRYMVIKTGVSCITGVAIVVWLAILGVDYAVLWGVLAFLLNYVPNIGSVIAAVPAVLLASVQLGGTAALLSAGGYVFVNVIVGNVLEPRFMGKGLGLSTLVVFLSLVFWGWVLGPVGMLLSVPLTMAVKIALESSEDTRWVAVLLGSHVKEKEVASGP